MISGSPRIVPGGPGMVSGSPGRALGRRKMTPAAGGRALACRCIRLTANEMRLLHAEALARAGGRRFSLKPTSSPHTPALALRDTLRFPLKPTRLVEEAGVVVAVGGEGE